MLAVSSKQIACFCFCVTLCHCFRQGCAIKCASSNKKKWHVQTYLLVLRNLNCCQTYSHHMTHTFMQGDSDSLQPKQKLWLLILSGSVVISLASLIVFSYFHCRCTKIGLPIRLCRENEWKTVSVLSCHQVQNWTQIWLRLCRIRRKRSWISEWNHFLMNTLTDTEGTDYCSLLSTQGHEEEKL